MRAEDKTGGRHTVSAEIILPVEFCFACELFFLSLENVQGLEYRS